MIMVDADVSDDVWCFVVVIVDDDTQLIILASHNGSSLHSTIQINTLTLGKYLVSFLDRFGAVVACLSSLALVMLSILFGCIIFLALLLLLPASTSMANSLFLLLTMLLVIFVFKRIA